MYRNQRFDKCQSHFQLSISSRHQHIEKVFESKRYKIFKSNDDLDYEFSKNIN